MSTQKLKVASLLLSILAVVLVVFITISLVTGLDSLSKDNSSQDNSSSEGTTTEGDDNTNQELGEALGFIFVFSAICVPFGIAYIVFNAVQIVLKSTSLHKQKKGINTTIIVFDILATVCIAIVTALLMSFVKIIPISFAACIVCAFVNVACIVIDSIIKKQITEQC